MNRLCSALTSVAVVLVAVGLSAAGKSVFAQGPNLPPNCACDYNSTQACYDSEPFCGVGCDSGCLSVCGCTVDEYVGEYCDCYQVP